MKNSKLFRYFSCLLAAPIILFTDIAPAHAATITVSAVDADTLNTNGSCSLREAITNINDGANTYGDCPASGPAYGTSDTINLPAGTYTIAIAGAGEGLNATGDYDILKSVAIVGAGSLTTFIDGGGLDRVFHIDPVAAGFGVAVSVSISGVTVTGGSVIGGYGGGIQNFGALTITNSAIAGNTAPGGGGAAGYGGAIHNYDTGALTITNSTIASNTAQGGGGVYISGTATIINSTISDNTATNNGGGIETGGGTFTITNSTIAGNTASGSDGYVGGGIYHAGGTLTITNSTISDNMGNRGGGIFNEYTLTIINSTISGNSGGAAAVDNYGTATLSNTIVANQIPGTADCSGTITSNGHNLESSTSCGFTGELQNTDPLLGPLASNGGPTQTMALLVGSPAIDAGDNAICVAPPVNGVDQRGVVRPQGSACDIGAYEVSSASTGPDLTGAWNSAGQSCGRVRCKLWGSVRVWNEGNATAPKSRLRVLLSDDAVLDPGDAVLHESSIGRLRPGRNQTIAISVRLPQGVSASGKYLFAVIDVLNSVAETDETNNEPMYGPIQ